MTPSALIETSASAVGGELHRAMIGYGAIGFVTLLIVAYTTCCVLVRSRPIDFVNLTILTGRIPVGRPDISLTTTNRILVTAQLLTSIAAGVAAIVVASLEGKHSAAEWLLLVYWVTTFVWVAILNMGVLVFPSSPAPTRRPELYDGRRIPEWARTPLTEEAARKHVFITYLLAMGLATAALIAVLIEHRHHKVIKGLSITTLVVVLIICPIVSIIPTSRLLTDMSPEEDTITHHSIRACRRIPIILISMWLVWAEAIAIDEFTGVGGDRRVLHRLPWVFFGISFLPFCYL